jgi:hypothetical protein
MMRPGKNARGTQIIFTMQAAMAKLTSRHG